MCGETIHAGVVQFDARPESACRGDPRNNKDPSGGFSRSSRAPRCAPHLLHCTYCAALAAPANRVALHLLHCTMCECETQVRTIVHRNKCNASTAPQQVRMRSMLRCTMCECERQAGRTPARAPQRGVANDATRGSSEENGEERHSIRITYYSSCPCLRPSEYPSRVRNGQCSRNGIDAYSSYCNSSNIERPSEYPSRVTANLAFRAWRIMRQRVTLTPAPTRAHAGEKRTARRMRRICDSLSHSRTPYPVV